MTGAAFVPLVFCPPPPHCAQHGADPLPWVVMTLAGGCGVYGLALLNSPETGANAPRWIYLGSSVLHWRVSPTWARPKTAPSLLGLSGR